MITPEEAADRVWLVFESIAAASPGMPISEAVEAAHLTVPEIEAWREPPADEMPDPRNTPEFARWLLRDGEITGPLGRGMKSIAVEKAALMGGCKVYTAFAAIEYIEAGFAK